MNEQPCYVGSEIAQLKRVILHRPDLSLKRLTPSNTHEFLFDDVVRIKKAGAEHDIFSDVLKKEGVEVLYLKHLLADVIKNEAGLSWLLAQHCSPYYLGQALSDSVKSFLKEKTPDSIADHLIGGITKLELGNGHHSLVDTTKGATDFVLPPLPNHLFTRDTSCWINNGVSLNPMAKDVRKRETINLKAIYQFHPLFSNADFEYWLGESSIDYQTATIEGGDVLVIGNGLVLIGLSERTTPQAVELLATALFKRGDIKKVVAVELPKKRSTMHLDTVMTMLDYDCFTAYTPVMDQVRCWELSAHGKTFRLQELREGLFDYIGKHLNVDRIRVVPTGGDAFQMEREQWNDANNLLCIRPGVVVGYEWNTLTIENLIANNITVHTIPGDELGRGRGGTRCMSCPIEREGL